MQRRMRVSSEQSSERPGRLLADLQGALRASLRVVSQVLSNRRTRRVMRSACFILPGLSAVCVVVQAAEVPTSSGRVLQVTPYAGLPDTRMSVLAYDPFGIPVVLVNPKLVSQTPSAAMQFSVLRREAYFIKNVSKKDLSKAFSIERDLPPTIKPSERYKWIKEVPERALDVDCYAYDRLPLIMRNTLRRSAQEAPNSGWLSFEGLDSAYFLRLKTQCADAAKTKP